MATRLISEKLNSGEITSINLGGTAPDDAVQTKGYIDAEDALKQNAASLIVDVDAHLASGDVSIFGANNAFINKADILDIILQNSIKYAEAADPSDEGLYLRIGVGGFVALYRLPDSEVSWVGTSISDVALTSGIESADLTSVTPDQDILINEGSYEFICAVDNANNQARTLTFTIYINSVLAKSFNVTVQASALGQVIALSGGLDSIVTNGDIISIRVTSSGPGVTVKGTTYATTFKVIKHVAAAAQSSLEALNRDVPRVHTSPIPLQPLTKAKIESVISGQILAGRGFYLHDPNHTWVVVYDGTDYWFERLTKAT